jgi:serine protease
MSSARRRFTKVSSTIALALVAAAAGCATAEDDGAGNDLAARAQGTTARYIVQFRDGKGEHGKGALNAAGAKVDLDLGPQNAVAAHIPAQALNGLQNNPNIEYIEEDVIRQPLAWTDSAVGGETLPWGVQAVQGNLVNSPNASNRTICIIDSGYSQQHVDLRDSTGGAVSGIDDLSGSGHWDMDSCGHGSHVAGTISAIAGNAAGVIGVNPGVKLFIVKVFGNDQLDSGACAWAYSSNLVDAVNKCRAAGANVISMSLGGGAKSRTEENAFKSAYNAGVLSIAAAGNDGNTRTSYPAGYASVMSVAAIDANEAVASFSQQNRDVEIAAPGVHVLSTVPWLETNTLTAGGTTWAGNHVEGAARGAPTGTLVDGGQCTAAGAWTGKVVLCQRGTNSFAEKVNNVVAGGGAAAVIYNNVTSDPTCGELNATLGTGVTSSIPAIALSCAQGAAALGQVSSSAKVVSSVVIPDSGYAAWDGTSMATPHVSAVAALVWSCNPGKTNVQIRNALTATAKDLGAAGKDNAYGYGLVQAKAALMSLGLGTCTVN